MAALFFSAEQKKLRTTSQGLNTIQKNHKLAYYAVSRRKDK